MNPAGRTAFVTATCIFIAALAYLFWAEHRAHLMGLLPYTLMLLCVGMHFWMHRGHGKHAEGGKP